MIKCMAFFSATTALKVFKVLLSNCIHQAQQGKEQKGSKPHMILHTFRILDIHVGTMLDRCHLDFFFQIMQKNQMHKPSQV